MDTLGNQCLDLFAHGFFGDNKDFLWVTREPRSGRFDKLFSGIDGRHNNGHVLVCTVQRVLYRTDRPVYAPRHQLDEEDQVPVESNHAKRYKDWKEIFGKVQHMIDDLNKQSSKSLTMIVIMMISKENK